MIDPDSFPLESRELQLPEQKRPEVVVRNSNWDVIQAVYQVARQVAPDISEDHLNFRGVLRLVYGSERDKVDQDPEGGTVHPVVDTLSGLVANGKVHHKKVPTGGGVPMPEGDPLFRILDRAWGPVYSFEDYQTGEIIAYSVKTATHSDAPTVLISPKHIQPPEVGEL